MSVGRPSSEGRLFARIALIVSATLVAVYLVSCGSLVTERAPNGFIVTYTAR